MENQLPSSRGFFDGNPKMLFAFGLVSGIALTLVLGNLTGVAYGAPRANNQGTDTVVTNTPTTVPSGTKTAGQLKAPTADDHVRGDLKKAEVVIVEYSDFECPFCERHHPTLLQAMEEYGDKIAWVYRHFPLSFHPEAEPSANASECADEQGKFWEYSDALFANQDKLAASYYPQLAGELGLNMNKFNECFNAKKYQSVIDNDQASGATAGVTGTPATFINGQMVSGAVPYSTIKQLIDAELAK